MARSPLLLGSGSERDGATRAAAVRIALGGVMLLAPGLGRRVFGIPTAQDNGSVRLVARLFGIRQVVLGAWTLLAQDRGAEERRLCYQLNAVTDAVDILALGVAGVTGDGLLQAAIMGSALGASEVLAWVDLLGMVDDDSSGQDGVALA